MKRLPSITRLQAFEAAARLGGFTQAARALNMTQGSVGYQVRMLERQLGVELFLRSPRGLVLTSDGTRLAQSLVQAFLGLQDALDEVMPQHEVNTLTVTVFTSFAVKWLIPRVAEFEAQNSAVELCLVGEDHFVDFRTQDRDVGVRYGRGHWPGARATRLRDEVAFPVCSPALLKRHRLRTVDDLGKLPLLSEEGRNLFEDGPDWEAWFQRAGTVPPNRGRAHFRLRSTGACMALQGAIEGQGIALARGLLVADDLASGKLVRPLDLSFRTDFGYFLVQPAGKPATRKAEIFQAWLAAAMGQTFDQILARPKYALPAAAD